MLLLFRRFVFVLLLCWYRGGWGGGGCGGGGGGGGGGTLHLIKMEKEFFYEKDVGPRSALRKRICLRKC